MTNIYRLQRYCDHHADYDDGPKVQLIIDVSENNNNNTEVTTRC